MSNIWYYYLHTNGQLIGKNPLVAADPEYFESPFVKKYWKLDTTKRMEAWVFLLEAAALGANIDRVREIAGKWGCNLEDSFNFLKRFKYSRASGPPELLRDGLNIFIEKIFEINEDEFWTRFKEAHKKGGGNGRV